LAQKRFKLKVLIAAVLGIIITFVVAAAAIAMMVFDAPWPKLNSWQDVKHQSIRLTRLTRYMYWTYGFNLPGTPDFQALEQRLASQNLKLGAPVFMRIFKQEFKLELWMKRDGRFHLFATYPICKWSGRLGPKLKTGDRQSPEGFYTVSAGAMNPASRWHRSFNLGFPNAYDRQHHRTGAYLMVHGGCSSIGCYAVTNDAIDEIWKLTTAAFKAGQGRFHVHVYPFRMTAINRFLHADPRWEQFWSDLKNGYDAFEKTRLPPKIFACRRRYVVMANNNARSDGEHAIQRACPPRHALSRTVPQVLVSFRTK